MVDAKYENKLHALTKNVRWLIGEKKSVELSILCSKTQMTTKGVGSLKLITFNALEGAEGHGAFLCPARTLEAYLDRTKQFRSPDQQKLIDAGQ